MAERAPGRSTLVLAGPFASRPVPGCHDAPADPDTRVDVLSILYRGTARDCLDRVRDRRTGSVSVAAIHVGPLDERASVDPGEPRAALADRDDVLVVSDPADVAGVSTAVVDWIGRRDRGAPAVACLDSLSALLQYVAEDRAFRFLRALTGQFGRAGVDAHVHLDPAAHDDRTVARFRQLFDDVRDERDPAVGTGSATDVAADGGRSRE